MASVLKTYVLQVLKNHFNRAICVLKNLFSILYHVCVQDLTTLAASITAAPELPVKSKSVHGLSSGENLRFELSLLYIEN